MTRVNLVHVADLADQHLFAEWRELKMVPAALRRSLRTKSIADVLKSIPHKYTMNTGHVLFFYDKMRFLLRRYAELTNELRQRDYDVSEHDADKIFLSDIPAVFHNDWSPSSEEVKINVERIVIRLNEKPTWYRHYGSVTPPVYFEELYRLQTI